MYFRMSRFLKKVTVTLLGAGGERQIEINARGGFPTRHIKVSPRETGFSSLFEPETPKAPAADRTPKPDTPPPPTTEKSSAPPPAEAPPTLLEVIRFMYASDNHSGWLIIDEILFVAIAQYKMKFNHTTLLDALRFLFQKGCLEHRLNRFNQHTFRLIEKQENHLKSLLAEVDAIMNEGGAV